jgi:uncharacterized protein YuzE
VRPGIVLDFDEQGSLVGIDIDHASKNVNIERIELQSRPARTVAPAS